MKNNKDVTILGPDNPHPSIGFTVYEKIGVGVINPRGFKQSFFRRLFNKIKLFFRKSKSINY